MLNIGRSHDRLIFNMGIPIHGKDGLYIETGPFLLSIPDNDDAHRVETEMSHAKKTQILVFAESEWSFGDQEHAVLLHKSDNKTYLRGRCQALGLGMQYSRTQVQQKESVIYLMYAYIHYLFVYTYLQRLCNLYHICWLDHDRWHLFLYQMKYTLPRRVLAKFLTFTFSSPHT